MIVDHSQRLAKISKGYNDSLTFIGHLFRKTCLMLFVSKTQFT